MNRFREVLRLGCEGGTWECLSWFAGESSYSVSYTTKDIFRTQLWWDCLRWIMTGCFYVGGNAGRLTQCEKNHERRYSR
jgi:hypothetical protein